MQLPRLACVLLVALMISGCDVLFDRVDCHDPNNPYIGMVRLVPPEGSRILSESCSMGFSPTQRLNFVIDADQLAEVQNSVSNISNWTENAPIGPNQRFEREAARATSYLYGTYSDGAVYLQMLIDTSNPDRYTVYYAGSFVD